MKDAKAAFRVRASAVATFILIVLAVVSSPTDHSDFVGLFEGSATSQTAEAPSEPSDQAMTAASDGLGDAVGVCGLLLICAGMLFSLIRRPRPGGREVVQRRWRLRPLFTTDANRFATEPLHRLVVRRC